MRKRIVIKVLISFILILSAMSATVFAYTDYENQHRSHYSKEFLYLNPYTYSNTGNVEIGYTYTQNGSYYFGYRIMLASEALSGTANYSTYYMDYNTYSPFNVTELPDATGANMTITSNNYGNVSWVGICSYQYKVKPIKLNDYFIDDGTYNYGVDEYTVVALHEMLHACGLDHYDCTDEVLYSAKRGRDYDLHPGDIGGLYDIY